MTIKTGHYDDYKDWSLVTSLYNQDIILLLLLFFFFLSKRNIKNKYLVTGDWSQFIYSPSNCVLPF